MKAMANKKSILSTKKLLIGGSALTGLCVVCVIIGSISNALSPKPTPDLRAINTAAVQSAWAPLTQAAKAWTATPVDTATPIATSTPLPTSTATLTVAQRISQYSPIDPRELTTYPDNHVGEKVAIKGEIFNINNSTELQIWVGDNRDAVYVVTESPFSGIYEKDTIMVYGYVAGKNCGTNAFGSQVCQATLINAFFVKQ